MVKYVSLIFVLTLAGCEVDLTVGDKTETSSEISETNSESKNIKATSGEGTLKVDGSDNEK